jgi:hypothetical protein
LGQKFAELAALASKVESDGACSLPGCSFDFNVFVPIMQRAVVRGFVPLASAQFVARGLWHGFLCGVDVSQMRGRRVFRNYPTSYAAADKVTEAVSKRVAAFKTMCLGAFDVNMKRLIPFDVGPVMPKALRHGDSAGAECLLRHQGGARQVLWVPLEACNHTRPTF